MAKTALEQWDETANNNTDIDSINIDEGCAPSGMNNAARATMSQIAKWLGDDTLASASTVNLGSVPGRYITITGVVAIGAFGTIKAGTIKYLTFAGVLTLTHNATTLILPGAANIVTAAGDTAIVVSEGSGNWRCLSYQRAAQAPATEVEAKFWAEVTVTAGVPSIAASFNVTSITDTGVGQLTVTIATDFSSANWACVTGIRTGATTVFANYSSKAAGSVVIQSLSLADALTDPAAYSVAGFGAQ